MKYFLLFVCISISSAGMAQVDYEIPFVNHLINKKYYSEAIFLIESKLERSSELQKDSLLYFHGWAHYSLKNLEQSTKSLLGVSKSSPFFYKSRFFAAYNQVYLTNLSGAQKIFEQMEVKEEPYLSLINFELAGVEMLQGNWALAKKKLDLIDKANPVLAEQAKVLENIHHANQEHRPKSAALAGIMSGIVPGSGKIYAGKTGAGIASLIGTIGFGLITWENYRKGGPANPKTIIFGSLFAFNYFSNIYGSILAVKVSENEYQETVHNQILFQLHIPLRNFFN